jgi:all-trans-retinol dehydrogenase (NAD+)
LGSPTILINNAGIADAHTILNTKETYLQRLFSVNVFSNFYTVKSFLPSMISNGKGHIITIASTASFVTVAGITDYCASKAAVYAFHEGMWEFCHSSRN